MEKKLFFTNLYRSKRIVFSIGLWYTLNMNKVEYKNILIVEDDAELRLSLFDYFSAMNKVTPCKNLTNAVDIVSENSFDIIILDVILPDGNGLKLLEYTGETPVVILSDLGSDSNLLDGLSAGAVDYIVKPCSPQVLEAKMSLRLLPDKKANISVNNLTINTRTRTAVYKNTALNLTSSEFNIIMFLMNNPGKFFTASEIYNRVWKMPHLNTETIKTHISNLRKKMFAVSDECSALIISEFGKGYAFVGGDDD